LHIAQAIAVQDFSVEQIDDRGEADMRVRPHIETPALAQYHRAHLVKEHERPDHPPLRRWQRAAHFETVAKISGARHDRVFEHGIPRVACHFRSLPSSANAARAIPNKTCIPSRCKRMLVGS
jgi:hypothetical protein